MDSWPNPKIIKIGNQELYDIGERLRFTIKGILPKKGFAGQFSLRDKVVNEAVARGKHLEVVFEDRPELTIMHNPIFWKNMGEPKKQVGYYKDNPMTLFWYNIDFRGEISKEKQNENQEVLFQ